jgi:ornithine--oxo-acid transaminase
MDGQRSSTRLKSVMSAAVLIELEQRWGARSHNPLDVVIHHAEGAWVEDVEGRRYLDCLAAYSSVNHGHRHPKILAAMLEQAEHLTITSRAFRNDQLPAFCAELAAFCGAEAVLPMNSGTEAVETAIKAARRWGYRIKGIPAGKAQVIVCQDGFHGRTITMAGFSSDVENLDGFGPFTPGFIAIPFGDANALERAITRHTCAFLVEPIQGDAGIRIPPDGYLAAVREVCTRHNVLFLADEIMTGLGRTGRRFGCDHEAVKPDVLILGKSLSGGFHPVSAVVSTKDVLDLLEPGSHGSTYGGNPLGCAVSRAALRVLEDERLAERASDLGQWFLAELRTLDHPHIADVRGRGLMLGVELTVPARSYCEALQNRGLLCKECRDRVLRLTPPLVVTREDLSWGMDQFRVVFGGEGTVES